MDKKEFLSIIQDIISDASLEDMKKIMISIAESLPSSAYEKVKCILMDFANKLEEDSKDLESLKQEIIRDFKDIENGDICLQCYSYGSGTYSYYGEDLDYFYYPSDSLNKILIKTYNYVVQAILHKKYSDALEIFELFLYTDYICEEIGDPEYDDSDEVYDTFETEIDKAKKQLPFDFDELLLYAIYAVIMKNSQDRNQKIYEYMEHGNVMIEEVKNLGIEKIPNFDQFYDEWLDFLKKAKK